MIRKLLLVGGIAAAIAGGVLYYREVTRPRNVILTGIVTTHDVIVSSQVQGRLAELRVKEGDQVKAGELVAFIEPQELKADRAFYEHSEQSSKAQVDEAEAALKFQILQTRDQIRQAEAQLAATESQQAEAVADLESARLDLERTEGLYKQQIQSAQAYDHARTAYEAADARLQALAKQADAQRAAVALARAAAEQVEIRRSQLLAGRRLLAAARAQADKAQVRLDYTEIRAPIDGLVAVSAARRGEVVNTGQPIVSLVNPDDFWVRADVEETYIDRVRLGDHMQVRLPSGVERTGTVFYRSVDADYATQRDVSRTKRDIKTFEIRLRVDNSDRRLWPGLTAFVTLPLSVER
jgi:HlyD family secretion protein